jgi:uncharacterized protein (TIGR03546 family)
MFTFFKLFQSLVKTLHSDGSPAQIALGIALGAALGLTPLVNAHNLIVLLLLMALNVSFGAGLLGWALFVPIGFALDPVFDRVGRTLLLDTPSLTPLWTSWFNTPGIPYTNFNNSVVLGSLVSWLVLFLPVFALSYWLVGLYRRTLGEKVKGTRFYQALAASKAYNFYRMFQP